VIDGICHPYNFSEENLNGRFGRIFDDILYAFHPLINPPETVLSKTLSENLSIRLETLGVN
jgi:hypothetical protein